MGQRPDLPAGPLGVQLTEGTPAQGYQSDVTTNTFQFLPATAATLAHLKPVVPAGFTQTAKPPSYPHG